VPLLDRLPRGTAVIGGGLVVNGLTAYAFITIAARDLGAEAYSPVGLLWPEDAEALRWLAEEVKAGVTGADTWPVDAVSGEGLPTEVPEGCVFCVHTYLQTRHGIVNQENLKLSQLAAEKIWVFAYVYTPVPIKGATGSIGSPLALY